ncbi:mitotic-spindle organizing gamma-tubulin ring associated-domain-containing protein, partial [Pavlovales sp. CCMP2436]
VPVLHELSCSLETGLDQETLAILLALCEQGVNPEALAAVIKELRREAAAL